MTALPDCQACPFSCCNYFSQCPDTQSPDPLLNRCWTSQFSSNSPTTDQTQNSVATTPANDAGNGNNPLLSSDSEHNDDSSNNNKSNKNDNSGSDGANVSLIIGVSVAALIGLLLIVLIIYCCKCFCWNTMYDVEFQGSFSNDPQMYRNRRQSSNQYPPPYHNPSFHLQPLPPYLENSQGVISDGKSKSSNKYKPSSRGTVA